MYEMKFCKHGKLIEEIDLIEYLLKKHVIYEDKIKIKKENLDLIAFDFDGVLTDNKVLKIKMAKNQYSLIEVMVWLLIF